jgi:hypothetical protein
VLKFSECAISRMKFFTLWNLPNFCVVVVVDDDNDDIVTTHSYPVHQYNELGKPTG